MPRPFHVLRFFHEGLPIEVTENRLPHWQQEGATYFLTYRLSDSLPLVKMRNLKLRREEWVACHPKPWSEKVESEYHHLFSRKIDEWLDQGMGRCLLKSRDAQKVVRESFLHYDGDRYVMHSFVIMPNHVHLCVTLNQDVRLEDQVKSWKRYTSARIERPEEMKGLWQKSYFDRLIRDREHLGNVLRYIRRNPAKAKLEGEDFFLYESEQTGEFLKMVW